MQIERINNGVVQFINNIPSTIDSIRCSEMPRCSCCCFGHGVCDSFWLVFVCEAGHELTIHHSPFSPTHEFVSSLHPPGPLLLLFIQKNCCFVYFSLSLFLSSLCLCVVCFSSIAADPPLALHHFLQIIMMDRGILSLVGCCFFSLSLSFSSFSIENCILFFSS